ncbi:unnamed protein product [Brachionus calyciflorus]|uniref:BZIP domain-containing protein n=1 Tax=Brachionus calyciflorus TaxID=104777 RepID=A0A813YK28_9BILA|nr:unnamed protein product [Brachionus calyciflorus]
MTKSSPNINNQIHLNTEFRQMSNPIPISSQSMVATVNASSLHTTNGLNWQPRINQEDSTQFDPGIMDTSVSPASYSLSPQQYMPQSQYQYNSYQPVYQVQNDIQFDLESLLVNATLSDNTQSSSNSSASFVNALNEDENCANQINPSFLFKNDMDFNNNAYIQQQQQQQQKPARKHLQQLNKTRNIMKIDEELDSDLQFFNSSISSTNHHTTIACSLPLGTEFQLETQRSDPVLTQLILNPNQQHQPQQQQQDLNSFHHNQFINNSYMSYQDHVYSSSLPTNYINFKRSNSPMMEVPPTKRPSSTNLDQIQVKTELIEPQEDDKFSKMKLSSSPLMFTTDNINDFFLDQQNELLNFKIEDNNDEDEEDEESEESDEDSDLESDGDDEFLEGMKRSKSDKFNQPKMLTANESDSIFSNLQFTPFSSSYTNSQISCSVPVTGNKTVKSLLNKKAKRQLKKTKKNDESDDDDSDFSDSDSNDSKKKSGLQSAPGSYMTSESLFDLMMSKNRDSYFWQYNIQSKGPKTKKVLTLRNKDPHLHRDFYDPVFQLQSLNTKSGASLNKLRKGDGNDVTPNPEKLYNLGNQIKDFIQKSYQINNNVGTSSSVNLSASLDGERVNLKREKNKIASRACRLKKKAQHEANKIKLFGLNEEHKQFIESINSARDLIRKRLTQPNLLPPDRKMVDLIDELIKQKMRTRVAGNTDGYVHSLMMAIEKQRTINGQTHTGKVGKHSSIDLNQFNAQYTNTMANQIEPSSSFNETQFY